MEDGSAKHEQQENHGHDTVLENTMETLQSLGNSTVNGLQNLGNAAVDGLQSMGNAAMEGMRKMGNRMNKDNEEV